MGKRKTRTLLVTATLIVASFLAVHLLFWVLPGVFESWNNQTVDRLFVLRSASDTFRPRYNSTIVHVDISDRTFELLENAYLNRREYARVVQNLGEMEIALQGWDFIFPARTNHIDDSIFVAATANARNVYFGLAFHLAEEMPATPSRTTRTEQYLGMTKWEVRVEGNMNAIPIAYEPKMTFPVLAAASQGLGFLNLQFDHDGVYRRAPLLVRYQDGFYPSFAFRAVCDYLGVTPDRIVLRPGKSVTLMNARLRGNEPHDIVIPIDGSAAMRVNFIGPLHSAQGHSMLHYDFADILRAGEDRTDMELWAEVLRGKIAVVSEVATGASDVGPVPTDNNFPLSGVHSNVINTILTENFLHELDEPKAFLVEFVIMVFLLLLSLVFASRNFSLGSIVLMISYLLAGAAMFLYGSVIVNILRPLLGIALATFSVIAYRYIQEQKERQALQRSFEAYFPPAVVRRIIEKPELVTQGGHKKELTILFSDIKSFTTYSSTMSPDAIQRALNEYFEAMVEIVFRYEGTVDKFIGDGLMVFFGDPEPQPDHAVRCVKAAIEMQKKCRELKSRWETEGKFPLKIRVGINTGPVVVGNMGASKRLSYTVLGADVNLAQRLESNAPVEGILISRRTCELVKDSVPTKPLGNITVKGLEDSIEVYEVPVEY